MNRWLSVILLLAGLAAPTAAGDPAEPGAAPGDDRPTKFDLGSGGGHALHAHAR